MTVVNLEDYRAPKPEPKPCTVTFMGFPFVTPEGISNHVNVTVPAEDGDYLRIMEVIRKLGGIWCPSQDGAKTFLPWPCAAVRVNPGAEGQEGRKS